MKMRRNLGSLTVSVAVATVLAACSANPVDETKNKKTTTVAKAPAVQPAKKVVSKAESLEKKKSIVAMSAKPDAAAQLAQAKAEQAKAEKAKVAQAKAAQAKAAQAKAAHNRTRAIQIAAAKAKEAEAKAAHNRTRAMQIAAARKAQRASQVRSPQKVGVRSPQTVGVRSPQKVVAARAPQPIQTRKIIPQRTKQQNAVRKQWVAPKGATQPKVQLASRTVARPAVVRTSVRQNTRPVVRKAVYRKPVQQRKAVRKPIQRIDPNNSFGHALSNAAIERTRHKVRYDGGYVKIAYPWGDVPKSIGVCTDVVIRAYRRLGIDLQQEVHKDISNDFYAYPNLAKWGLDKPDPNIDHRRVYNLQAFFKRHKAELPRSKNPRDYKPGDLVTWMLGPNFPHIGVVVNRPSPSDPNRLMIAHNAGAGPVIEDILFRFPMTGHYRYTREHRKVNPAMHFAKTPPPPSVLRKQKQKQMSYAQLLEASRYLNAGKKPVVDKQAKVTTPAKAAAKKPEKIYLAQLDSVLTAGASPLDAAAVQALLTP